MQAGQMADETAENMAQIHQENEDAKSAQKVTDELVRHATQPAASSQSIDKGLADLATLLDDFRELVDRCK